MGGAPDLPVRLGAQASVPSESPPRCRPSSLAVGPVGVTAVGAVGVAVTIGPVRVGRVGAVGVGGDRRRQRIVGGLFVDVVVGDALPAGDRGLGAGLRGPPRRRRPGGRGARGADARVHVRHAIVGDGAVMSGWLARAQTLLGGRGGVARGGWVVAQRRHVRGRPRPQGGSASARRSRSPAGSATPTSSCVTLAYLGASLVHADRTEEGMVLLDEALAAVAGSEVDDFIVLEEIFCQLFSACEHAHDVARADQWIRVGEAIADAAQAPGRVGVLPHPLRRRPDRRRTLAGGRRRADRGGPAVGPRPRVAAARRRAVRLADLRVRQGRFEEAEQLLDGVDVAAPSAARPLAAIHLARGETALAGDVLERALGQVDPPSTAAAPLLALLVDVHLAAGDSTTRRRGGRAAGDVRRAATASHYLAAAAALARGRVCLAAGTGDPQACLREALAGFARAQMPMELAHSRLELANALRRPSARRWRWPRRGPRSTAFERLQAARHADAAAAVLRSLGVRATGQPAAAAGVLTKREAEVLELLGHGLSNPEISDRLYISRKTVEHHVGNVLAKLGLRSRAEAAAYAARTKPAHRIGDLPDPPARPSAHPERPPTRRGHRHDQRPTTRSSSAPAAPARRPRCCWPARATGCCWSTGRRSRATPCRPT